MSKYQSLADVLRQEIAAGQYPLESALPTEAELSRRFSVSRQTVRQAVNLLENDGMVYRRQGSGTYVTNRPRRRVGERTVGVITTYITDYIFPSIVRGIESVLSASDCVMTLSATYNRPERERALLERVLQSTVDGLIIEGTQTALPTPNLDLYQRLREHNIPFVALHGCDPRLGDAVSVTMEDRQGGRMAVEALLRSGHRSLGGVFKRDDIQGPHRYEGFEQALRERNVSPAEADVCWFSTENKAAFFRKPAGQVFLRRVGSELNGIVCYNDEIALALLDALGAQGLSVPDDVSLVSFDNSAYSTVCHPRLTTLAHAKEAFGRRAAELLLRMMSGQREQSVCLPWTLIERESVKREK